MKPNPIALVTGPASARPRLALATPQFLQGLSFALQTLWGALPPPLPAVWWVGVPALGRALQEAEEGSQSLLESHTLRPVRQTGKFSPRETRS